MISDLVITPLKRIENPKGNIFHILKCSENSFSQFGEAYFSTVNVNDIKGWKNHSEMILNLVVPVGSIKFVIYDGRENSASFGEFHEEILSLDNYCRLTVPPGVWMAFQGKGEGANILLNIASIEHDPLESKNVSLDHFDYNWSLT